MASDRRAARLGVLAAVAVILFGALGARLWFLQTVQASDLQQEVDARNTKTVLIAPERGQIFDHDGRLLAGNEVMLNVVVDWAAIRDSADRATLFQRLSGWVDVPVEEMEERYDADRYSRYLPLPVAEDVPENVAIALRERIEDFPGISIERSYRRVYPYAPLAAHVVGYMGAITENDEQKYIDLGYDTSSVGEDVGRAGVEESYETTLHGQWGEIVYEVDSHNRIVREISRTDPVNGQDVQLSIDLDVQQYAERLLQTKLRLQRAFTAPNPIVDKPDGTRQRMSLNHGPQVHYEAPAGSVVIMNYQTGQIAAVASYPTFDNRWFSQEISREKFDELFDVEIDTEDCGDEGQPECPDDPDEATLTNRAVQGQYNLGSSFKPFVAWSALNAGFITAESSYYNDTGTYKAESIEEDRCAEGVKCVWRNSFCSATNGPCVYGDLDVYWSLAVSSDAYYYHLGEKFFLAPDQDRELLQNLVQQFGFGADTGVDLPHEFDGRIPDHETKADLVASGALAEGEEPRVLLGDVINMSIGQGLLAATPLQLAVAYSTIANGGYVMIPRVVEAIYPANTPSGDADGFVDFLAVDPSLVSYMTPAAARQIEVPDGADQIIGGLRQNILGGNHNGRSTTAGELFAVGYPDSAIDIAGKTGTAQGRFSFPWNDSSVFAAFSQDTSQPYTVVVYLEKAGFGSRGAAPVVKCLFLALSDPATLAPVEVSQPLDPTSDQVAAPQPMADTACMESSDAHTVFPGPVDPGRPVD